MIAYIEGRLAEVCANACVVVTEGGVGYEVYLPQQTRLQLPERGGHVRFYICHIVREDAQELFGFETWDERQTFIVLTSISKVGARTALGILSAFRPDDLRRLVLEDDVLALTQVSGIGKKSAQHIFLELKYKLKVEDMPAAASLQLGVPGSVYRDALTGLEGLGYAEAEAAPVLKNILHEEPDFEAQRSPPCGPESPCPRTAEVMSDSPNTPSFLPPADLAKELSAPDSGSPGDESIRPSRLEDFIGQEELRANLRVFLNAARERGQAMDHVLFYGNPGLGKTTLAQIMAAELGVNLICTSGPVLERSGDLAAILTNLSRHDILFVDEIHRMPIAVEEILYPALEDYKLDLVIGQGPAARTVKINLEPFTLVGATTRIGLLSSPLRDRFGIISRLEFYTPEELSRVVIRSSRILGVPITEGGALEIGRRSRGTPRIANRLLRRVRDFAAVYGSGVVDEEQASHALRRMDVDENGLDQMDRKLLRVLVDIYGGGPVGVKTLAVACSEEVRTIEDIYEPYLIQCGFLKRTSRGRMATAKAYKHLNMLG